MKKICLTTMSLMSLFLSLNAWSSWNTLCVITKSSTGEKYCKTYAGTKMPISICGKVGVEVFGKQHISYIAKWDTNYDRLLDTMSKSGCPTEVTKPINVDPTDPVGPVGPAGGVGRRDCRNDPQYKKAYENERLILKAAWENTYHSNCNKLEEFIEDHDEDLLENVTNKNCYQQGISMGYKSIEDELNNQCLGVGGECTDIGQYWGKSSAIQYCNGEAPQDEITIPFCTAESISTCIATFHEFAPIGKCYDRITGPNGQITRRQRSKSEIEKAISETCTPEQFTYARTYIKPQPNSGSENCIELGGLIGQISGRAICTADQSEPQKPTVPFCPERSVEACFTEFDKVVKKAGGCFNYRGENGRRIEMSKEEIETSKNTVCNQGSFDDFLIHVWPN
ncbi:MAG: hypothetical protein HQK53_06580 [Oligoflexia bacterium]|nr:hypothetical protein [Oligoflexia bacterium]